MDKDVSFYLSEHADEFPGVEVVPAAVRDYPNGHDGRPRPGLGGSDRPRRRSPTRSGSRTTGRTTSSGKSGLEKQYERFLQGHKGRQKYLVNSNQEIVRLLGEEPAVPGDDLVLSLDIDTQRIAEQALVDGIEHTPDDLRRVAGPARLPQGELRRGDRDGSRPTGGIKALASWPTFDPSWFVQGLSKKHDRDALRRRLGGARAQPGDAAVVRAGIDVQAVHRAGGRSSTAWRTSAATTRARRSTCIPATRRPSSTTGPPRTSARSRSRQALKVSCDTVFYQFGRRLLRSVQRRPARQDATLLQDSLRQFGFGAATKLDLPLRDDRPDPRPHVEGSSSPMITRRSCSRTSRAGSRATTS